MAQRALDLESRSASAGDFDPFEEALGPSLTAKDFDVSQSGPKGKEPAKIHQLGETATPRKSSSKLAAQYEKLTREHYRAAGAHYDKCSHTNSYTGKKFDMFGFADGVAVFPDGNIVFVQTTGPTGKSSHVTKMLTETYSIFGGHSFKILDAVLCVCRNPFAKFVLVSWSQPDGPRSKWVGDFTEITEERIQAWMQRRKMSQ